jgi:predicted nucleic acid-binding protein
LTLLIDAGPIVALADPGEPLRERMLALLKNELGALIIPAPTTAEIDHLLGQRFGKAARRAFLRDLAAGRFAVMGLEREDYSTIVALEARYSDLDLGLADCALITPFLRRAPLPRRHSAARWGVHNPPGRRRLICAPC